MTIERIINGVVYEFPDGTPEAVIRKFERQKTGGAPEPAPAPSKAAAPRPAPFSTGAGSQFLQGLTAGFSDEAIAGLRSAMGHGKYEDLVKSEREALRQYGEEHPVIGTAAEIAGGALPAVFTGGAALVPGITRAVGPRVARALFGTRPTIGRAAATGAAAGATTAVGTSEKSMSEMPEEAAKGAVAGAATAGALGAATKYALAPAFQRLKQAMGFGDANKAADIVIARALEKDGLTPDQALAKVAAAQRGEITLADLGENTARLLRNASTGPGEARRFVKSELAAREAGRGTRVGDDLRSLMSGSKDFYTDVQDLIKKRAADADALYKEAYDKGPAFTPQTAPEIEKLRALPSFVKAMRAGATRMQDQGLDIADPKNTLRALHETKLALDDMIETAVRDGQGNQAKTLIDMKRRLLTDMEKASPEYRTARQTYAGDSEMLAAMNEGRSIYQLPEPEMRAAITRFTKSPSEYDAFRAGIAQAMLEKIQAGGPAADPLKTVFPKGVEEKVRRAFRDDAAFEEFKRRLLEERQMLNTEATGFRKTPIDTDLAPNAAGVGAATSLMSGRPVAAGMEALRSQFPSLTGMPPRVAQPVAQKLLTPSAGVSGVIDSIMQSLKLQEQQLLGLTGAAGTGAALTGGLGATRSINEQYPEVTGAQPGTPLAPMAPPAAGAVPPLQLPQ